jgi:nitroreductase
LQAGPDFLTQAGGWREQLFKPVYDFDFFAVSHLVEQGFNPLSGLIGAFAMHSMSNGPEMLAGMVKIQDQNRFAEPFFGLQPWRFIIVTDDAIRRKLQPHSWDQPQITDCSHLVVFTIKKHLGEKEIDAHLQRVAEVRGVSVESLAPYRARILGHLVEGPHSLHINVWAWRQVYIALGNFMTCAAMLGVDTCPIEGFEPDKYDSILGLAKRNLAASVVCAAGYRAADDKYATLPKVRFDSSDLIERI